MIVYTGGTFDLFHTGHVNLLRYCRRMAGKFADGGRVIVSLNTDEFVEAYKGRPPVVGYEDRKAVLESCRYVNEVIMNTGGADSKPTILSRRPDAIVIGSDWHGRDYMTQLGVTWDWLRSHRIALIYVPNTEGISSTSLREKL